MQRSRRGARVGFRRVCRVGPYPRGLSARRAAAGLGLGLGRGFWVLVESGALRHVLLQLKRSRGQRQRARATAHTAAQQHRHGLGANTGAQAASGRGFVLLNQGRRLWGGLGAPRSLSTRIWLLRPG